MADQRNIFIQNVASGAFWASRYYSLSPSDGTWAGVRTIPAGCRVSGLGSHVITAKGIGKRFLAVYFKNDISYVFDGNRETKVSDVSASWKKAPWPYALLCFANLSLSYNGKEETILYFRPSWRHWFEGGWTLDDTDMAHTMNTYINDSEARERLRKALRERAWS